jgi:hypothetical protein
LEMTGEEGIKNIVHHHVINKLTKVDRMEGSA